MCKNKLSRVNPPFAPPSPPERNKSIPELTKWQTPPSPLLFLSLILGNSEEKRQTEGGERKQRLALSFFFTKHTHKKKWAEEKTQRSLCSCVQMHSISCGWKSLGLRPALSIRRSGGEHSFSLRWQPQHTHTHTHIRRLPLLTEDILQQGDACAASLACKGLQRLHCTRRIR